jgi:uncharacterized protein with FMN-binding domain
MNKAITGIIAAGAILYCTSLSSCAVTKKMKKQLESLPFPETVMADTKDGTYIGSAKTMLVKAEVSVEIKDGHIMHVKILRHDNGKGKKAEAITTAMEAQNTWDVDSVSGATTSSLVIKSAAAQAIAKGVEK